MDYIPDMELEEILAHQVVRELLLRYTRSILSEHLILFLLAGTC